MGVVALLLDKAKGTRSIPSDNALSVELGVSRAAVSDWRKGDKYPTEQHIARLAKMAREDAESWFVRVQVERTEGEARAVWVRLAQRMGWAAVLVIAAWLPGTRAAGLHFAESSGYCLLCKAFSWVREIFRSRSVIRISNRMVHA